MQSSTSDLGLGVRLAGDNPHLVGFSNVLHKCKPRGTPGSLLSPACRRHEDSGRIVASLDRKCPGQKAFREFGTSLRGIFDKETYRRITGSSRLTGPSLKIAGGWRSNDIIPVYCADSSILPRIALLPESALESC